MCCSHEHSKKVRTFRLKSRSTRQTRVLVFRPPRVCNQTQHLQSARRGVRHNWGLKVLPGYQVKWCCGASSVPQRQTKELHLKRACVSCITVQGLHAVTREIVALHNLQQPSVPKVPPTRACLQVLVLPRSVPVHPCSCCLGGTPDMQTRTYHITRIQAKFLHDYFLSTARAYLLGPRSWLAVAATAASNGERWPSSVSEQETMASREHTESRRNLEARASLPC